MLEFDGIEIHWLGNSGFKIKTEEKVIYIDPYHIEDDEKADLILITHSHPDHCSPGDIEKISTEETIILCGGKSASKLKGNTESVKPNMKKEFGEIVIETVPAYNTKNNIHPKEDKNVGYIIIIDDKRIYHAGDTDLIPEIDVITADIAMLPVAGKGMDAREAADAANKIKPEIAIPIHWGNESKDNAKDFSRLCKCEVKIMEKD